LVQTLDAVSGQEEALRTHLWQPVVEIAAAHNPKQEMTS